MPKSARVDVVGLGLNAVDTVILVRAFPSLGGKERITSVSRQAGGQVATAMVTCRRLGLRTRYVGTVGGDEASRFQLASLRGERVDTRYVRKVRRAASQLAYIVVDQATGERTVFWDRDPKLAMRPRDLDLAAITSGRILHLDGCDVEAAVRAAAAARRARIPVVADLDTVYPHVERLLPSITYLIASSSFVPALTGETDPFRALERLAAEYKMEAPGMTLGREGALILHRGRFSYSPGFVVETVDTTGAGDVFHGAFILGLRRGWPLERALDFSNAMAALNCTAFGARGRIATEAEAERLVARGERHINAAYQKAARRRR